MVTVIIPTYNAGLKFAYLLDILSKQTLEHKLIVIDSGSTDDTQELAVKGGAFLFCINKAEFNHGSTRNLGLNMATSEIVIFMTQDATPVSFTSLATLVHTLRSNDNIAMSYGRQIPYEETGIFGRFSRMINYPKESIIKNLSSIPKMGIKTCSCSNSFAAYNKFETLAVGGFPEEIILGEDVSVAARFILKGRSIAYCAEAEVYHSHDYTIIEEFKRYFDIGVFHEDQKVILKKFSSTNSEGWKYYIKELTYLINKGYIRFIPAQIFRVLAKYIGYKLGLFHYRIPNRYKPLISMHSSFWIKKFVG